MTPGQFRQVIALADLVKRRLEAAEFAHRACADKLSAVRANCTRLRQERAALSLTPDCEAGSGGVIEMRRAGLASEIAMLESLAANLLEERAAHRREVSKRLKQKSVVDATLAKSWRGRRTG
jgi:hypothetical protein